VTGDAAAGGAASATGHPLKRVEDAALLRGRGRFAYDLPVPPGTLHAAILRSPYAHAELLSLDMSRALEIPGVACVVTGEDARRWTRPFAVAVKSAMEHWCLAILWVRYVGEPVAVALASSRAAAERCYGASGEASGTIVAAINPPEVPHATGQRSEPMPRRCGPG
jgi:2-furoyl-CoA dehydrogenase large subunit